MMLALCEQSVAVEAHGGIQPSGFERRQFRSRLTLAAAQAMGAQHKVCSMERVCP
jgi:hypothetical protein